MLRWSNPPPGQRNDVTDRNLRSVRGSPDPEDLKDTAEDLLIFLKREDVFIYNGNTIEYHVCGPRWKNYTWKIDLNKT